MLTRRRLMQMAGSMAGSAVVYSLAAALGAVPSRASAQTLTLGPARPGRKVLVLGAGIAGLLAAWELESAGYETEVLEASHRIGGRSLTLRHGDLVDEVGNRQICNFDDDPSLYFNAGPSRIPHEHAVLIDYCRRLDVPLLTHVNSNTGAWAQFDRFNGGERMRIRQFVADARGMMSELSQKGLSDAWLDQELGEEDRDLLRQFLRSYGDLAEDGSYKGSSRAGYASGGLMSPGILKSTTALEALLQSDFWRMGMHFTESSLQSAVLEPAGGMDRIVTAVAGRLRNKPRLHCVVKAVHSEESGVRVIYREQGVEREARADYCLNSIPTQLLVGIDNNFSQDYLALLQSRPRGKLSKIGLQMKTRFWEAEGVYGGISWTGQDITQIIYPSEGFGKPKGIVVGAYVLSGEVNDRWMNLGAQERIQRAVEQGEKLHPGYASQVESGVSVAWYRMNHMLGCTAMQSAPATAQALRAPFGRHYLIGDQAANYPGWQESAVLTAVSALNHIQQREEQQ
ncbi:MAG: flavin monoamine oxidase family protein [Pseudohongiellaceae bacterium]